jgi:hypothetical protein
MGCTSPGRFQAGDRERIRDDGVESDGMTLQQAGIQPAIARWCRWQAEKIAAGRRNDAWGASAASW